VRIETAEAPAEAYAAAILRLIWERVGMEDAFGGETI